MKSMYRAVVVLVMVMTLLMNPVLLAAGNPVPGRWEKVAETKPGEKLNILMESGITHQCRYQSIDDESLICSTKNKDTLKLDLVAIDKVVIPKAGKYAKEWAIWGAIGGAFGGAIFPAATDPPGFDSTAGGYIAFAGIGAILGALGGGITGAAVGAPGEIVYISKDLAMGEAKK